MRRACWLLALVSLSGCGSSVASPDPAADSGAGGAGGAAGAGGGPPITVSGLISEFFPTTTAQLPGVKACVEGLPEVPCATTDADGRYVLAEVPGFAEVTITLEKSGFVPAMVPLSTRDADTSVSLDLATLSTAQIFASTAGYGWPPSGGILVVEAETAAHSAVAGVSVSLDPPQGTGPVYVDESETPDPALDVTSAAGWGSYGDVPAGRYALHAAAKSGACTAELGFARDDGLELDARVGWVTYVLFGCAP